MASHTVVLPHQGCFSLQSAVIVENKMVGTNGEVKQNTYMQHIDYHLSHTVLIS